MLGKMLGKLSGGAKRFSGKTDFLEGVCAGCALVAAGDGDISDDEVTTTVKTVTSNENLKSAFNPKEIDKCINRMLDRAKGGRTGRAGLYKEIEECAHDHEMAEIIYLSCLDVAEADGNIGAEEKAVLAKVASKLGVNPDNIDV